MKIPRSRDRAHRPLIVLRHVPHEGLGTIATYLHAAGIPHRYVDLAKECRPHPRLCRPKCRELRDRPHPRLCRPKCRELRDRRLPRVASIAGLIVMGGPMGVYEKERFPFLKREIRYIRKTIEAGLPVLGICLGSQLIAHALGARVYPNNSKEIGWYRVRLTPEGKRAPLMKGSAAQPWVFQWHGDTFDLPRGAQRLASSALCKNQAFRFGANVYALQYHLEVDGPMVREWLDQPGAAEELAAVGAGTRQKIKRSLSRRLPGLNRLAHRFFSRFAGLITPIK